MHSNFEVSVRHLFVKTGGVKRKKASKNGERATKKPCKILIYKALTKTKSARDEIRTHTPFRALPPQSSASTNFATHAYPGGELNPYFRCGKQDFKSCASTDSATRVKVLKCQKTFQIKNSIDQRRRMEF